MIVYYLTIVKCNIGSINNIKLFAKINAKCDCEDDKKLLVKEFLLIKENTS